MIAPLVESPVTPDSVTPVVPEAVEAPVIANVAWRIAVEPLVAN